MKSASILAFVFLCILPASANGQPCVDPLQVDISIEMPPEIGAQTKFSSPIERGLATVSGVVTNQPDGRTARMDLAFDYSSPEPIAFDELIECIEGAVDDFAPALINTNLINLNPNSGITLVYSVTLYHPRDAVYEVRLRVWGNYE